MGPSPRHSFLGEGIDRILTREIFFYFLDLEVKRSRRYQNFFSILVVTLAELPAAAVDMLTLVVIGNRDTVLCNGKMVTRRGYGGKYDLAGSDGGADE